MALSASSFTTTPSGISASPSLFSTPATSTFTSEASPTDVNTLFSGSSRSLTETSSVYINTSYTYSPTSLFSSSTPLLSTSSPLFANPTSPSSGLPSPTEASTRQRGSKTASNPAATSTLRPIVPSAGQPLLQGENGLILNLSLGGDDVGQAVYSVPMVFGHASGGAYYAVLSNEDYVDRRRWRRSDDRRTDREVRKRKRGEVAQGEDRRSTENLNPRPREKRAPGTYQSMNLQVDLGSSDLWVAATTCQTSDCRGSGVQKLNVGNSIDAGTYVNLTYQSGHAAGEVYWDEVQMGVTISQIESAINGTGGGGANGFDVGYQAFVAANDVGNEDLSGGQFSGVLGLALPANSVILNQLGGSTSGAPDGAPFLDNLFGSGANAPQGRYFSLSLERLGDSRTKSSLGIGTFDNSLCPAPCVPSYSSVVTSSVGPLYWRIPLQGITAFTWPSGQAPSNTSATSTIIKLPSSSVTGQSYPVAVLDSGGYQVLMGDKSVVDAIYAVFGGSQASDGNYYLRCDIPLSLALTFNGKQFPVHPLDMSDYSATDPSHKTCLGLIQYASGLTAGDLVLGASYLKNVYSIYTYPSSSESTSSWLPMVGMLSLTNVTTSAQEFYDVRVQHSTYPGQVTTQGSTSSTQPADSTSRQAGHQVLSGGIIALAVVLGFVGVAAALFCAWFFWLRKKYGTKGVPVFSGRNRKGHHGSVDGTDGSIGGMDQLELTTSGGAAGSNRRSKKSRNMQRQKSMIDGLMDFDTDLWSDEASKTDAETATSKSMDGAGIPILGEELARGRGGRSKAWESSYPPAGWSSHQRSPSNPQRQERSPSSNRLPSSPTDGRSRSSQRFADADEGPYPTFSSFHQQSVTSPSHEPLMFTDESPQTPRMNDALLRHDSNTTYQDSPESRMSTQDPAALRPFSSRGSILRIHDPLGQRDRG